MSIINNMRKIIKLLYILHIYIKLTVAIDVSINTISRFAISVRAFVLLQTSISPTSMHTPIKSKKSKKHYYIVKFETSLIHKYLYLPQNVFGLFSNNVLKLDVVMHCTFGST